MFGFEQPQDLWQRPDIGSSAASGEMIDDIPEHVDAGYPFGGPGGAHHRATPDSMSEFDNEQPDSPGHIKSGPRGERPGVPLTREPDYQAMLKVGFEPLLVGDPAA